MAILPFMDFAKHVKAARKSSGLTQTEVAEQSGVSRSAVVDLERGRGTMSSLAPVAAVVEFRIRGLSNGNSFGDQVIKRRSRLKWTQAKLAKKTGLTLPTIRAVEKNHANLNSFAKVIDAIGIDVEPRKLQRSYWRGGQRDVRHTPPQYIEAIVRCFGSINCDPCHDAECYVRPITQAITKEVDGLKTRWEGDVAFVNPPYSDLTSWLKRITLALERNEVRTIIGLLPVRSETHAFQDHVLIKADLLFPRGRLRFYSHGKELGPAPFPLVFPIWNGNPEKVRQFAQEINAVWLTEKVI